MQKTAASQTFIAGVLRSFLAFILLAALPAGCASTTRDLLDEVASVEVCLNGHCGPAAGLFTAEELTGSLFIMLKANENSEAVLCGSEAGSRECDRDAIGWFVQGGPMPGKATMKKPVLLQVGLDKATTRIEFDMDATVRWIGTPVFCGDGHTRFTSVSAEKVTFESEFGCTWTAFPHVWDLQFSVSLIDFDNSVIAGNYAVAGAGFYVAGGGKGSFILRLPQKNTLVSQVKGAIAGKARLVALADVPSGLLLASVLARDDKRETKKAPSLEADPAERKLWETASRKKTAESYREYLKKYPDGRYAGAAAAILTAIDEREKQNRELTFWSTIKDSQNPGDFETYISRYPEGLFVDLATVRIQRLNATTSEAAVIGAEIILWDQVKASTDISEIQVYIKKFPDGRFSATARDRIKKLTAAEREKQNLEVKMWSLVKDSRKISDLQNFRQAFPDGLFAEIAAARMENLIRMDVETRELTFWNRIKDSSDPEEFNEYLNNYPTGQYADHARRLSAQLSSLKTEQEEVALWVAVKDSKNPERFETYLKKYPGGRFVAVAKERQKVAALAKTLADIDFGSYHALVIGNNDYRYIKDLKTAENDARAVARLLKENYNFKVTVLLSTTRSVVMTEFSRLRRQLTRADNLLIYYAGHGLLDEEADEGYWLPVDAAMDNETNWISNSSITTALKAMKAKHIFVVADSCYSGKLVRGLKIQRRPQAYLSKMVQKKARVVMSSGGLEPVADSGGTGRHSVFAAAFIDVLLENENVLDSTLFFSKIRHPVMVNSDQTPEYADIRRAGHEGGDFFFVRRK
jgi:outer membrane protein assembly factor BamD (BamD/ComL family)